MAAAPTGIEGPLIQPGSTEWLQTMSASKVAAAIGLSPFESPFSLYHRMAGNVADAETDEMRRGHYLEPAIVNWFADQHPELAIRLTGTWAHPDRPWQTATPDRLIVDPDRGTGVLEVKTSADDHEWGELGTDEIPIYYRTQVLWQLDTLGLDFAHVAVLTQFLEFRGYLVEAAPAEAADLRNRARAFLDDIEAGRQPPLDGHTATYQTVRQLHPDIDGSDVELDDDLAARFLKTLAARKAAEDDHRLSVALVADAMGTAQRARWDGHTIASRQTRNDSTPFVVAGRKLPDLTEFITPQPGAAA